ncbi:MAG: SurA N-terminal domain-containing protein, partial [Myxococcales bacterium]|nr:SurA N-terminal domain-containing protein [Myxococcales bacterium]
MLDVIRRGQRWVTAIFVVGIGSVFVFYLGGGGGIQRGGDALIQVGEIRIDNYEYGRFRDQQEQRYRDALGEQFDARKYRDTLDDLTTRLVVERAIMALEAEALGLSVPKQELERQILEIGGFRNAAGRFDKQAFDNWVGRTY